MHRNRLERLAALLEKEAYGAVGFDLAAWGTFHDTIQGKWWQKKTTVRCYTCACAVGAACLSGEFKEDGLGFTSSYGDISPTFNGSSEWDAVQDFFGISRKQAHKLFSCSSYDGPTAGPKAAAAVARRIRKLIARPKRRPKPTSSTERTAPAVDALKRLVLLDA